MYDGIRLASFRPASAGLGATLKRSVEQTESRWRVATAGSRTSFHSSAAARASTARTHSLSMTCQTKSTYGIQVCPSFRHTPKKVFLIKSQNKLYGHLHVLQPAARVYFFFASRAFVTASLTLQPVRFNLRKIFLQGGQVLKLLLTSCNTLTSKWEISYQR